MTNPGRGRVQPTEQLPSEAAHFAAPAALSRESLGLLATGASTDPAWSASEAVLIDLCDALHDTAPVDAAHWDRLRAMFSDEAILEAVMVVGYHRMISHLVNVLDLPLEPGTTGIEHPASASAGAAMKPGTGAAPAGAPAGSPR